MKTALILSGGGAKGAFSVGALSYIMNRGDISFDIISGTSTGALIASLVTVGKIEVLEEIYTQVTNDDIIRKMDPVKVFRNKQLYFYSDGPLMEIIDQNITEDIAEQIINSEKTLFLTAVNLYTGKITVFSNKQINSTDKYEVVKINDRRTLIDALRASSNQAAFLPPVNLKANDNKIYQFIDGGCREVIPCMAVTDQNPTRIYVLSNNAKFIFPGKNPYESLLDILMRVITIMIQDVRENDIAALESWRQNQPVPVAIHYIEPDKDLDPDYPTGLRFDPSRMESMMAKGSAQALAVLDPQSTSRRIMARTAPESTSTSTTSGTVRSSRSTKCKARTQQNTRCKNAPMEGSDFCHLHQAV